MTPIKYLRRYRTHAYTAVQLKKRTGIPKSRIGRSLAGTEARVVIVGRKPHYFVD
jgi:hypothetical protein